MLISNNFGRRKNNPVKDRKAIVTYVELKGYKHGEIGNGRKKTCQNGTSTLDERAKELNISKRNLQRALRIQRNLTETMKGVLYGDKYIKYFGDERYRRSNFYFSNFYFGDFIYNHFFKEQQKVKRNGNL